MFTKAVIYVIYSCGGKAKFSAAINPSKIIDKNKKKCLLSTKSAYYNVETIYWDVQFL